MVGEGGGYRRGQVVGEGDGCRRGQTCISSMY